MTREDYLLLSLSMATTISTYPAMQNERVTSPNNVCLGGPWEGTTSWAVSNLAVKQNEIVVEG